MSKKARKRSKQKKSTWKKTNEQPKTTTNDERKANLTTHFPFQAVDGDKFICMDSYTARDCLVYSFGIRSDKPTSFQIQKYIYYVQYMYQNGVPINKDYLKVLQRWLGLWGLDGFTKLHSNKILKEYKKLKCQVQIFLLNINKNKSGGCPIPLSPYHRCMPMTPQ